MDKNEKIVLSHGGGGTKTLDLIKTVFARHFANPTLDRMGDSAVLRPIDGTLALTTDAFVVKPLVFHGGDIGKLAVCGTVNDLAVSGARPLYLTASFIIEEGMEIFLLDDIVSSMALTAKEAGVSIVAGDTKVVEHGSCDRLFITTSGLGRLIVKEPLSPGRCSHGDVLIINGSIADHGMAIMSERNGLSLDAKIESDCAPLNGIIKELVTQVPSIKFMRDATRGGLGMVLNELVTGQGFGVEIDEIKIPVNETTSAVCELLGLDPIYVANEGKFVCVISSEDKDIALKILRAHKYGKGARVIGRITAENTGRVIMKTAIGTARIISAISGDQLPRIC